MAEHKGKVYGPNDIVDLDGNAFTNCTFNGATLVYRGSGPVGLVGCTFNGRNWRFEGAALQTLQFLGAMFAAGDRALVEGIFQEILQGPPKRSGGN